MNNKLILKEILPVKLTNDSETNIKLIKRKLNIYNLKNQTNYRLNDLGIDIIYNIYQDNTSIFYFYKEIDERFNYKLLNLYQRNFHKASKFFKNILEGCEAYKNEDFPDSIFLFKGDKFILDYNLKSKYFRLSYPLIWSKLESSFDYSWLEISNLCNVWLEQTFKKGGFTTLLINHSGKHGLEEDFKKGEFTVKKYDIDLFF